MVKEALGKHATNDSWGVWYRYDLTYHTVPLVIVRSLKVGARRSATNGTRRTDVVIHRHTVHTIARRALPSHKLKATSHHNREGKKKVFLGLGSQR